ncbi:MAG: tail fiber domain-containing protein [Bacteroidia bacterium]|nr:tail fiber domain-containing protein [Bacteroidia bacterium]
MRKLYLLFTSLCLIQQAKTQNVGIGTVTPHSSARLEVTDNTRGILIPRVSLTATNTSSPVSGPETSLLVYNTNTSGTGSTAVTPGYYFWNGSEWVRIMDSGSAWRLNGNYNGLEHYIGTNDNFDFPIRTNGTEKMRITTDGNVGIGTTSPNVRLTIANNVATGPLDNYSEYQALFYDTGDPVSSYGIGIRPFTFVFNTDTDFHFDQDGVTRVVINNGSVGIGITTPMAKLHVYEANPNADVRAEISLPNTGGPNAGRAILAVGAPYGSDIYMVAQGGFSPPFLGIPTATSGITSPWADMVFATSNTGLGNERMRIDNVTGNVSIGGIADPDSRLQVAFGDVRIGEVNPVNTGSFPGWGRIIRFSGGPAGNFWDSENSDALFMGRYNIDHDQSELRMRIGDNCTGGNVDAFAITIQGACTGGVEQVRFRFVSDGQAYKPGGGSWAVLSDARLKTAITPFNYGLNEILKINPITFQYNGLTNFVSNDGQSYVGVLAQEIQKIAPFMVKNYPSTDYLSVDPSAFTYMLINAIKEQQSYIQQLEQRIKKLESSVNKN